MLRLTILLIATILFSVPMPAERLHAFSPTGCEGDCAKCHSLGNQDVKVILQRMKKPQAEILKIQLSPVKGLWEISIDEKGKRGLFYMDFSKKYLIPGPIIEIKSGSNITLEQFKKLQESKKVDFSRIPLTTPLVMGNRLAPQKVAVFTDPDCSFCRTLHQEMEKVVQERKDMAFYLILFPLPFHKEAYWKSKSIVCNQSLKMLEEAYAHKEIPKTDCDTKEIDANIKLAESLGITGTPTLVFSDGRVHSGTLPANQIIALIPGGR
ncbi:MAG: DsbC family protein [Pseudomonadota bacterium]